MAKLLKALLAPVLAYGQDPTLGSRGDVHAHYGGHLWSLSPKGQLLWRYDKALVAHVEAAHGVVYALEEKNDHALTVGLAAIDDETGLVKWDLRLDCNASCGGFLGEAPVAADGTIYVTLLGEPHMARTTRLYTSPPTVHAVDAGGQIKWTWTSGSCSMCEAGPPILGHDGTVFVTQKDALFALRPENGKPKWSIQDVAMNEGFASSGIAVGRDGTIYVIPRAMSPRIGNATSLLIIDSDGNLLVNKTLEVKHWCDESRIGTPYVGFNGDLVYTAGVGCGNMTSCGVCAFDREGELLWKHEESSLLTVRSDETKYADLLLTRKLVDSPVQKSFAVVAISELGSVVWEANISKDYVSQYFFSHSVCISPDNIFYFPAAGNRKVLALHDGNELWEADTDVHTGPAKRLAVANRGMVYAQSHRTTSEQDYYFQLEAIDSRGSQMWKFADLAKTEMRV